MTTSLLALALLLAPPGDREPVDAVARTIAVADGTVRRIYTVTLGDGSTVVITRRYPSPPERPDHESDKAIDLLAVAIYQEYLRRRIELARHEADDVLEEAHAAALGRPSARRIVIPEGGGWGPLESRVVEP